MENNNPHKIPTLITGWAVIAVVLGAMWGTASDPAHAGVSAAAVVAIVAAYLVNKVRMVAYARRTRIRGASRADRVVV